MTDAGRYGQVREILFAAAELEGEARARLLDERCGDDAILRAEVEALLDEPTLDTQEIFATPADPLASSAFRTPDRIGSFRVVRELGRGGMGIVYEALDGERRVALKRIYPHLLASDRVRDRFEREAAMGLDVRHPNVVRTLGLERIDDDLVLVMEFAEGRHLRDLLQRLGRVPETLLRELASQAASGLAAIHDAGIVHRDLKPENVLLSAGDNHVRIMDLGIAKVAEASMALTHEGEFVGSLQYAAPEQVSGGEIGPAADLYSLGVLLYELATGANPFERENALAVLAAHVESRPMPIIDIVPDISPFFSAVVSTLLEKSPARRFESAHHLAETLRIGTPSPWWQAYRREAGDAASLGPRVPVSRALPLRSREQELKTLEGAWARARAGRGSTLLIEGAAGYGKTRLVDAFLRTIDPDTAHVLYGAFRPDGGLDGLTRAIRESATGSLEDALQARLARTDGTAKELAALLDNETLDGDTMRGGAFDGLVVDLLDSLAAERPTVWVLDDLHDASDRGRRVAAAFASTVHHRRALIVITSAPGAVDRELSRFERNDDLRRLPLGPIAPNDVREMLEEVFVGRELAVRISDAILERSEGVPMFVEELVRSLREEGFVTRKETGRWTQTRPLEELEIPSAIRDVVAHRLASLSEEHRTLLGVAATQGDEFDGVIVAAALGESLVPVLQRIAEIERRFGVVRSVGRRFRFDHQMIRELLYEELPPALRDEYHRLIADAFADTAADPPSGEESIVVAEHYLRSTTPEKALPVLDAALRQLANSYRQRAQIALARRALGQPDLLTGAARIEVLLGVCRAGALLSDFETCRNAAEEARRALEPDGDTRSLARTYQALASVAHASSDIAAAIKLREKAHALSLELGDEKMVAQGSVNLGMLLNTVGRHDEAVAMLERAVAWTMEHKDRVEPYARLNYAILLERAGRPDEALPHLAYVRAQPDRSIRLWAECQTGNTLMRSGDLEAAARHLETSLELALECGVRIAEIDATGSLARVHMAAGRHDDALSMIERQIEISLEVGDLEGVWLARTSRAWERLAIGMPYDLAREDLTETLAYAEGQNHAQLVGYATEGLGELAFEEGDLETAKRRGEDAEERLQEAGLGRSIGGALLLLGRVATARGDEAEAERRFRAAIETAREVSQPSDELIGTAHLARLGAFDLDEARSAFERLAPIASITARKEAAFELWRTTEDETLLATAYEQMDEERAHLPPEHERGFFERVMLNRAIRDAWEKRP